MSSMYIPCPVKVCDCCFSVFLVKVDDHVLVTPLAHVQCSMFVREQHCAFLFQADVQ